MKRLAIAAALVASGCATRSIEKVGAPAEPLRPVTLDEAISAYDSYARGLETLNGTGDLDVKDFRAGKERKLSVRLLAAHGGRLYVKGSVLLVTGLEVVADGERFWFQVPSRKTIWTGRADADPTAEGAQSEPYYALRPGDVSAGLLPQPIAPAAGESAALETDGSRACVTVSAASLVRRRACLERASLAPKSLSLFDAKGDLSAQIAFAEVREGAARRVSISRPREGYLAAFAFEKLVRNGPVPERAFAPRAAPDYKVVEVTP